MSVPSRGKGFTLVELLVVIGIIALLISMLLPTLNKAREQGRTLTCLSNQRQIGQAIMMYVAEHKGWMPQMDKLDRLLDAYMISRDKGSRIWTCVSRNEGLSYVTEVNPINYCFSLNTMVYVNGPGNGKKMAQIRQPARALLMGDGRENQPWGTWIFIDTNWGLDYHSVNDKNCYNDQAWFTANGHKLQDPVYIALADVDATGAPSGLRYRHNRNTSAAILFVDGHAEAIAKRGLRKENFITRW